MKRFLQPPLYSFQMVFLHLPKTALQLSQKLIAVHTNTAIRNGLQSQDSYADNTTRLHSSCHTNWHASSNALHISESHLERISFFKLRKSNHLFITYLTPGFLSLVLLSWLPKAVVSLASSFVYYHWESFSAKETFQTKQSNTLLYQFLWNQIHPACSLMLWHLLGFVFL